MSAAVFIGTQRRCIWVSLQKKNLLQKNKQVYVVLFSSVVMGGVFGCSFGLFDVEDDSGSHRRFDQDQVACAARLDCLRPHTLIH